MKKKLLLALLASVMMVLGFSFAAFADDDEDDADPIEVVNFEAYVADDTSLSEGATYPEFYILNDEGLFDMTWENPSSDISSVSSAKNAKTFTLTFTTNSDNYIFTTDTVVNATGVEELVSKKVKDDGETLVVKVDCYVYYQLNPPEIDDDSFLDDPTASKIKFSKNGANTVEYYIVSTNSSGSSLTKHGTTTSSSISISSLTKEYSETQHDNGYEDKCVVAFWIRAKDVKNCSNPYIAPSEWISVGDEDPDAEVFDYDTWGEFIADKGMSSSTAQATIGPSTDSSSTDTESASGPTGSSSDSSTTSTVANGWWDGSDTVWYYTLSTGGHATGWVQISGVWYYLDPNQDGLMLAGLQSIDGYTYYFNAGESDSVPYGAMLTGWQTIGGATYFFRQSTGSAGEPEGAMIFDKTVAIDGVNYTFDAGGVLTGQS